MTNPVIYHFLLDHRIGGPHIFVETIRRSTNHNYKSIVVTSGHGPMSDISLLNLRHWFAPFYLIELLFNTLLIILYILTGKIRRENSIFHVHGGANLAPLLAARFTRIKVIWHLHETVLPFRWLVELGKYILKGTDHVIAVVAIKSAQVYGVKSAVFLPATVDSKFWAKSQVSQQDLGSYQWADGSKKPLRIIAVGNLNPLKGVDILLTALETANCPVHLQIIGAPLATHHHYLASLRQQAMTLSSANPKIRIDFLGWQDKVTVRALLATCDVFVLPSRSEACPIALLEAMSMHCFCIAADVGDVSFILQNYPRSIIFRADSYEACRDAFMLFQINKNILQTNLEDGITSQWHLESVASRTETLYRRMLG